MRAVLGKHCGNQKSEKAKADEPCDARFKTYETVEYFTARLDRDHPTIAAQVHAATLSARAGAIRADIICELSPLEKAQAAFRRLTRVDRDAFDLWRAEPAYKKQTARAPANLKQGGVAPGQVCQAR